MFNHVGIVKELNTFVDIQAINYVSAYHVTHTCSGQSFDVPK